MLAWGTLAAFAKAIGEKYGTVKAWAFRNDIPGKHWPRIALAAERDGKTVLVGRRLKPITVYLIAEAHGQRLQSINAA